MMQSDLIMAYHFHKARSFAAQLTQHGHCAQVKIEDSELQIVRGRPHTQV